MNEHPKLVGACERIFGPWGGTLRVSRDALARAYRARVLAVHPDRAAVLNENVASLTQAFQVLEHDRRRVEEALKDRDAIHLASAPAVTTPTSPQDRPTPRHARSPQPPRGSRSLSIQAQPPRGDAAPARRCPRGQATYPQDPLHALLLRGHLTLRQVVDARAWLHGRRPRFGSVALDEGLLEPADLSLLLAEQGRSCQRLGDIAVSRSMITPMQRLALLGRQRTIPAPGGSLRSYFEARKLLHPDELARVVD